jgi:predicted Zn-dependent protease
VTAGIMQNTNLPAVYQYQVARLYSEASQLAEMNKALDRCLNRLPSNVPPDVFLDIARMYSMTRQADKVEASLRAYLKVSPRDWQTWIDLARIQVGALNKAGPAAVSLQQAVRAGGEEAMDEIDKDPAFSAIRPGGLPDMNLLGVPGLTPPLRSP